MRTPSETPVDKQLSDTPESLLRQRRHTPVRFAEESEVFIDDNQNPMRFRAPHPPSRASMTSVSSGRGSSGHEGSGKTTSLSQSRGDSIQDSPRSETQSSSNIIDKTTSSSSGIASRTVSSGLSVLQSSTSPGQSSGISASSTSATTVKYPKEVQSKQSSRYQQDRPVMGSPHSEPIFPSYAPPMEPLDVSVDENYEFDSISPLEAELIEKLRREQQRWRQWQRHQQQTRYEQQTRGPFSDSEVYGTVPSRRRNEDPDARCAALKEEFFRFRRRQQYLQQQEDDEQSSSDEFESAC